MATATDVYRMEAGQHAAIPPGQLVPAGTELGVQVSHFEADNDLPNTTASKWSMSVQTDVRVRRAKALTLNGRTLKFDQEPLLFLLRAEVPEEMITGLHCGQVCIARSAYRGLRNSLSQNRFPVPWWMGLKDCTDGSRFAGRVHLQISLSPRRSFYSKVNIACLCVC